MNLTFEPLLDRNSAEIAALANRAFEGYVVDVHLAPPVVAAMARFEAIDLGNSYRALCEDREVGIVLAARRGWSARVAAMAVCPEARRQGVGRQLMERVIQGARERGERRLCLEVIEQNPPAIALYESLGFQRLRRLVGYGRDPLPGAADPALEEIDIAEAARQVIAQAPGLPWQIAGETIAQMGHPNRAYRLGPAVAVLSSPEAPTLVLRALCVPVEQRRQGWGRRLLLALGAHYPQKSWGVGPVVPEDAAPGFFAAMGFRREDLSQFEMELRL